MGKVREEVMFRALQAVVLPHLVEERGVLELQVIDTLNLGDCELVLDGKEKKLDQLAPGAPRWVAEHLRCENW